MKVLIIGNGAREHAIAWKIRQCPSLNWIHPPSRLFVAPGNGGTAKIAKNVPIAATDIDGLLAFAGEHRIDLTVVGPEQPLADGIVDRFQEAGLKIFGPTQTAAQLETSKWFAKQLMLEIGVPTGQAEFFTTFNDVRRAIMDTCRYFPLVVKADRLAAGKGVKVCYTKEEACQAAGHLMNESPGGPILLEEFLEGQEVSVFAFVADRYVSSLVAAVDYKQVGDGDTGSNTGGMGAYSPPVFWTPELEQQTRTTIMQPVAEAMTDRGSPYRGILYAGLILTKEGTKVLEFNCRFGDPETQVILPRLKTDLLEVMWKIAQLPRRPSLDSIAAFEWDPRYCVGVVLASAGYPTKETYDSIPIHFLHCLTSDRGVIPFHAGTEFDEKGFTYHEQVAYRTNGGRVLTLVALGDTLQDARKPIYTEIRKGDGFFEGALYRTDIPKI